MKETQKRRPPAGGVGAAAPYPGRGGVPGTRNDRWGLCITPTRAKPPHLPAYLAENERCEKRGKINLLGK